MFDYADDPAPDDRAQPPPTTSPPEFQHMIKSGTSKPAPFDTVVMHSFSRFFHDHFEIEFYVRALAKNGVKLMPITQEIGDDPMHQMMALFDKYRSKENARQGSSNDTQPPIGYALSQPNNEDRKPRRSLRSSARFTMRCKPVQIPQSHGDACAYLQRPH